VDKCAENNGGCSEHATCTNIPDSVYCTCNNGYTGDGFNCTGKTLILLDILVHELPAAHVFLKVPLIGFTLFVLTEMLVNLVMF